MRSATPHPPRTVLAFDLRAEIQENVDYEEMKTVLKDVLPAKVRPPPPITNLLRPPRRHPEHDER